MDGLWLVLRLANQAHLTRSRCSRQAGDRVGWHRASWSSGVSMSQWALPAIAVMLIGYGAVSGRLRSTPISQAMVFVTLGLLAGNRVVDLVDADMVTQFVRRLAEATLTLVLFTDAVRVNRGRLRHESALPTRLLGVGLPLTVVAGTLAALVLFPQMNLWTAAALATML